MTSRLIAGAVIAAGALAVQVGVFSTAAAAALVTDVQASDVEPVAVDPEESADPTDIGVGIVAISGELDVYGEGEGDGDAGDQGFSDPVDPDAELVCEEGTVPHNGLCIYPEDVEYDGEILPITEDMLRGGLVDVMPISGDLGEDDEYQDIMPVVSPEDGQATDDASGDEGIDIWLIVAIAAAMVAGNVVLVVRARRRSSQPIGEK